MRQRNLVLGMLRDLKWPRSVSRKNVLRKGQTGYEGFVLGRVGVWGHLHRKYGGRTTLSIKTKEPKYKELFRETKKLLRQHDGGFNFTSIQYNKNHRSAKHIDGKNTGISYIIGLGNYTGGDLIVYDEDGKNPVYHNIKNRFYKFNGSKYPHETAPFQGERYSLVFYSTN